MLPIVVLVEAASSMPPAKIGAQASAIICVERPAIATSKAWDQSPRSERREVIRRGEHGEPILVRVIDYQ